MEVLRSKAFFIPAWIAAILLNALASATRKQDGGNLRLESNYAKHDVQAI